MSRDADRGARDADRRARSAAGLRGGGGDARLSARSALLVAILTGVGVTGLTRIAFSAASNGGVWFVLSYAIAIALVAVPALCVAWTIGRTGAAAGCSSPPGTLDRMTQRPWAKYLGALGLVVPLFLAIFFTLTEGAALALGWLALRGRLAGDAATTDFTTLLRELTGSGPTHDYVTGPATALAALALAFALNAALLTLGRRGLGLLATFAAPLIALLALVVVVRVWTLPGDLTDIGAGLRAVWSTTAPRSYSHLWWAAVIQALLTVGVGFGIAEWCAAATASQGAAGGGPLRIAGWRVGFELVAGGVGLAAAGTIFSLAGQISDVIPDQLFEVAFIAVPDMLRHAGAGTPFAVAWFALVFVASLVSAVALCRPTAAFFEGDLRVTAEQAGLGAAGLMLLAGIPIALGFHAGAAVEAWFWTVTLGLAAAAVIQLVLFGLWGAHRDRWDALAATVPPRLVPLLRPLVRVVAPLILVATLVAGAVTAPRGLFSTRPLLRWDVPVRAGVLGSFVTSPPDRATPPGQRFAVLESQFETAVRKAATNLMATAEVTINPSGPLRVTRVEGDRALLADFGPPLVQEWLDLQNIRYVRAHNEPLHSVVVTIEVEGVYRAGALWLARLGLLFDLALVLALIHWTWTRGPRAPSRV